VDFHLVFSCGGEAEKERIRVEREIKTLEDSSDAVSFSLARHDSLRLSRECPLPDEVDSLPSFLMEPGTSRNDRIRACMSAYLKSFTDKSDPFRDSIYAQRLSFVLRLDSLNNVLRSLP
jgi:hypothetical protein